jgi:hypothetical protein
MRRGWSAPELGPSAQARLAVRGPRSGPLPILHEFRAHHGHLARGVDAQPDLPPLEPDDRDTDIVADEELFHQFPRQNQHATLPLLGPVIES